MRRIALIAAVIAAGVAVVASGAFAGGEGGGDYEVRAVFDNGAFLVPGEEVRVAGARVGTVSEVEVSREGEAISEDGSADPGKAIVVLEIDDPGFQDFRADASCLIRPQSLIGEKFVECEPTQPRAPDSPAPPPLVEIPEGEPGEGQRLLPLERNGKAVDLDLVNNIMEEPYPDRFRLILNDLGAGLAARGDELAEVVERSNPALRRTNQVLAVLARQNRELADLARDGAQVLGPLARERDRLSGFINESTEVAAATAERGADLEATLQRLPAALRELRPTMSDLTAFADRATPVFSGLADAAPSLVRASEALGPFSTAANRSLRTLGAAAAEAQAPLVQSEPVVRQVGRLARSGKPLTTNLARLLRSLRRTQGFDFLTRLIFNGAGSVNAFDSYGHFLRALLPLNNCVDYVVTPEAGCDANFNRPRTRAAQASANFDALAALAGAGDAEQADRRPRGDRPVGERDARALLDFLVGPGGPGRSYDGDAGGGDRDAAQPAAGGAGVAR